jgi:hypothetical protein
MTDLSARVDEHQLIGVNSSGEGPVDHTHPSFHHWSCWCVGARGRAAAIKFNGGRGAVLCPDTSRIIWDGFPPGWKPLGAR